MAFMSLSRRDGCGLTVGRSNGNLSSSCSQRQISSLKFRQKRGRGRGRGQARGGGLAVAAAASSAVPEYGSNATIKVLGIGGAGGNAINRMISSGVENVTFMAMNTDVQALERSYVDPENRVQLGSEVRRRNGVQRKREGGAGVSGRAPA